MVERDFILRQVQQLAQVLAQVLTLGRAGQAAEAQKALADGLEGVLGLPLDELRSLPREELLAMCASGGVLSGENGVAVADLLREDEAAAGRERALWLYECAITSADTAVPFDVHQRIETLRTSLRP